jgi:PhnB protein
MLISTYQVKAAPRGDWGGVMAIQPYLFFDGRCEEAIEFYRKSIGAEVKAMMRWKDAPGAMTVPPGGNGEKVMHATFSVAGTEILASDGECQGRPAFGGFGLSLWVKGAAEATRAFAALGEGGSVRMPLAKTFFAESFGMVADKFGVLWLVIAEH